MLEIRIYLRGVCGLVALAILASVVMTLSKVPVTLTVSTVGGIMTLAVTVMGFITLIFAQQRAATITAAHVQEVAVVAKEAAVKVDTVAAVAVQAKEDLIVADKKRDDQMAQIQATGIAVHKLVNSEHGMALRSLAQATQTIASLTHTPEDQKVADLALTNLKEHERKQALVDADQIRNRERGKPEA